MGHACWCPRLAGSDLDGARLFEAALEGVDLSRTLGLRAEALIGAMLNDQTRLPESVRREAIPKYESVD